MHWHRSRWVEILANLIRVKITAPGLDNGDTRIDRQRRLVGLIMLIVFILLPAAFLGLWMYFPAFAERLFR